MRLFKPVKILIFIFLTPSYHKKSNKIKQKHSLNPNPNKFVSMLLEIKIHKNKYYSSHTKCLTTCV